MAGDLNTDREVAANVRFTEILPLRKTGHTSKGDQLKWKSEKKWYKADYMGYEGLAEVLVSHLLQKSTMRHPFVLYCLSGLQQHGFPLGKSDHDST